MTKERFLELLVLEPFVLEAEVLAMPESDYRLFSAFWVLFVSETNDILESAKGVRAMMGERSSEW